LRCDVHATPRRAAIARTARLYRAAVKFGDACRSSPDPAAGATARVDTRPIAARREPGDAARFRNGTPVAALLDMADEPAPKPVEPPAAKSSKAVLGLLVVNLVASGFAVFKLLTVEPVAAAPQAHAAPVEASSEVTGPVIALDPFVVNLDEPGTSRYLKVTLEMELFPHGDQALAKSKQLVRDTILSHLSGLHLKDTLGAEAKDRIRTELMAKLSKLLGPDKVRRMFFQDFVVQ
jgi:flagellar protein FliL